MASQSQRRPGPIVLGPAGEEVLVSARLGWLYLDQGHLDEAETIFEAVLEWRADEPSALSGLAESRRARRSDAAAGSREPSLRERKMARLRSYLDRLRRVGE